MANASGKSPLVALILSMLIPGLGQFYVGHVGMGMLFLMLMCVALTLTFTIPGAVIPILVDFGISIWAMVDAYKAAQWA